MSLWTLFLTILFTFGLIDEDLVSSLGEASSEDQSSVPVLSLIKVGGANNGNH